MDETSMVEPKDVAAPSVPQPLPDAAQPPPEAPTELPKLPDELLKIPAVQGLIAGTPPAVSASIKDFQKRDEAKQLIQNQDVLLRAGMGFYRSLSGDTGVIFNQLRVHPEQLKQADAAGKLLEIAPPFDKINEAIRKSGVNHPSLTAEIPQAPPNAPMAQPPQAGAMVSPPPAAAQKKLLSARMSNLSPGAPTSGPAAGQGQLLRSILKPVVGILLLATFLV